jgi:triacylglycerol esterase/lipase EstA (alpha/beta hydrolase family)
MLRHASLLALCASLALVGCTNDTSQDPQEESDTTSEDLSSPLSPEFWGQLYLDMYSRQLAYANTHIEAGPPRIAKPRTVLLITGVTIKAAWLDPIAKRLQRDGFKTVVYEPPGLLSGSLFQASADLGAVVDRVRADSGEEKIDILAECTGGLISRYYIQSLGGDKKISRLVTFVSPENGIAKLPLVSGFVSWPALRDLTPGSAFLHAVESVPLPATVPMTSIYTCTDEYIQPYQTSIVKGATNIGLCGHGFVGHFQTMYDPSIYLIMHEALVKDVPPATP